MAIDHREHMRLFQRAMVKRGIDASLIIDRHATHWLTGFRGTSSFLLVFPRTAIFITDSRYIEVAQADLRGMRVVLQRANLREQIRTLLEKRGVKNLGLEEVISHREWQWARRAAPLGTRAVKVSAILEELRAIKSTEEIKAIRAAVTLTDQIFNDLIPWLRRRLKRGTVTELDAALWLKREFEERGAEGPSFPPIVAAGANSARPHAVPGNRPVRSGHFLLFDFGLILNGHCSDMTRTIGIGNISPKRRRIYEIVAEAQLAGIAAVRAGRTGAAVDEATRSVIREAGYAKQFGHGTGHGVGIEIHESPRVSGVNRKRLKAGNVITIEPGIYVPGFGGVRIEDMVVVRDGGCEVLTQTPKAMICL